MTGPSTYSANDLSSRVQQMMTTLGERLTHLDREMLREAGRRAGHREEGPGRQPTGGRSWGATGCGRRWPRRRRSAEEGSQLSVR